MGSLPPASSLSFEAKKLIRGGAWVRYQSERVMVMSPEIFFAKGAAGSWTMMGPLRWLVWG